MVERFDEILELREALSPRGDAMSAVHYACENLYTAKDHPAAVSPLSILRARGTTREHRVRALEHEKCRLWVRSARVSLPSPHGAEGLSRCHLTARTISTN